MALSDSTRQEYFRLAQAQHQLYSYWFAAGNLPMAHLAMDVANGYYQQLGIKTFLPPEDPTYVPAPKSPEQAAAIAATLNAGAGEPSTPLGPANIFGAGGSGSGALQDLASGFQANYTGGAGSVGAYCSLYPDDPLCQYGGPFNGTNPVDYCTFFPEDPACYYSGGGTTTVEGPVTIVNVTNTTIVVNQQGLTLADVAARIKGAVQSAAAAIIGAVDAAFNTGLHAVQSALSAVANELIHVFSKLARLAGLILKALQTILLDILHGVVRALQGLGHLISQVLQHGLMPALQALEKLRARLIEIYQKILRPTLIIIQDIRKVLAILKIFHVGFAAKLDAVLADIQGKITAPLLYLMRWTNTIANYINLILDYRLLLQRPLFLASLKQYMGRAIALAFDAMSTPIDPADRAAAAQHARIMTQPESQAAAQQFLTNGTGPMAGTIADKTALFDKVLQEIA